MLRNWCVGIPATWLNVALARSFRTRLPTRRKATWKPTWVAIGPGERMQLHGEVEILDGIVAHRLDGQRLLLEDVQEEAIERQRLLGQGRFRSRDVLQLLLRVWG